MPAKAPTGKGPLGVLKKKIGPAPVWVWFAVGLLLFVVYRRFASSANNTGATPVVPQTAAGTPMDSSGASGGGGSASGAGMNVDPNQLLDAYRAGGSDYSNLFGSLLPYFYYGSGSTDYGAINGVGSGGGPAFEGAQQPTLYGGSDWGTPGSPGGFVPGAYVNPDNVRVEQHHLPQIPYHPASPQLQKLAHVPAGANRDFALHRIAG